MIDVFHHHHHHLIIIMVYEKMKMVFDQNEWEEALGLKTQGRRKVNREVIMVEGLMHNLVKVGKCRK